MAGGYSAVAAEHTSPGRWSVLPGAHAREQRSVDEASDGDPRLLDRLEQDGRLRFADLAERVGLFPGASRARTLCLLDGGVVKAPAPVRPEVPGLGYACGFAVRPSAHRRSRPSARGAGRRGIMPL
ncbi:AsnC family transcriptional regulator [Streptomyces sp. NPDC057430]|uniref:AsnC family transcriptional regulator n=1 Tax=unclassified Streptomyces TaxID=2593676 RepID=UPI0036767371